MYTQCPQCLTYFQVTPEHLRIAQGNVRCGQCRNVFSALGNLTEEPPQVAYEDNDSELEEEIFIDEGELEDYAEEYSEEFYVIEEEIEEEFEEEIADEEPPQPASVKPIDLEKTNIIPPQNLPQTPAQRRSSISQKVQATPNSSKLSEAIATIEKLKKSYSNLSFRQLESRGPVPNVATSNQNASNQKQALEPPQPRPEASVQYESTSAAETDHHEPPHTSGGNKVGSKLKPITDIAIEHFPEDDGVDYEEALNALNELKIIEEESEEATSDDSGYLSQQVIEPEPDQSANIAEDIVEFQNDLSIDDADILNEEQAFFTDQSLHEELIDAEAEDYANHEANGGVKVKSLDRKAREHAAINPEVQISEPQAPPKQLSKQHVKQQKARPTARQSAAETAQSQPSESDEQTSPPKYLPAIPKQLLEDFHPHGEHISHSHTAVTLWSVGSILLMVVFLVQTVYFKHNDLAKAPQLRPWVETFCGLMSCEMSLPSDVSQLELVSQDIRSHPKVKSALLVTTTIINNAHFVQSYPGLQITFSDLNGQRVAMRRFAPNEYLSKDIEQESGMPPNTPIQVELEMMDPGSNAVNFEFDFIPMT